MSRWIPHVHRGETSEECTVDDDGGREGFYLNVCWLGIMVSVSFSSSRREHRWLKREGLPPYASPESDS